VWLINLDPTVEAEIQKTRSAVIVNDDAIGILPLRIHFKSARYLRPGLSAAWERFRKRNLRKS
jgi:hypothetical protein